jgi:DNA-binding NarL/FixJ family response regulator
MASLRASRYTLFHIRGMPNTAEDRSECRRKRVLLVDDHALVRHGIAELVNSTPELEVVGEVANAQSALRAVAELAPDLIVLDLSLPDAAGIELVKRLRARDANVRILVYSMHEDSLYAQRALRAGAQGYVNKSESGDRLLAAMREVLESRICVSSRTSANLLHELVGGERRKSSSLERLTDRELEIVQLIGSGMTTRDIARHLSLSIKTIDSHRANIKAKLGLRTASELAAAAGRLALEQSSFTTPAADPARTEDDNDASGDPQPTRAIS